MDKLLEIVLDFAVYLAIAFGTLVAMGLFVAFLLLV